MSAVQSRSVPERSCYHIRTLADQTPLPTLLVDSDMLFHPFSTRTSTGDDLFRPQTIGPSPPTHSQPLDRYDDNKLVCRFWSSRQPRLAADHPKPATGGSAAICPVCEHRRGHGMGRTCLALLCRTRTDPHTGRTVEDDVGVLCGRGAVVVCKRRHATPSARLDLSCDAA